MVYPLRSTDEVQRVAVVLAHTRCDGEDVWVKNNIFGREADALGEQSVCPRANLNAALVGCRLTLLVKCHHDQSRARALNLLGALKEQLLALLQRERVDNRLALDALQRRLNHLEA